VSDLLQKCRGIIGFIKRSSLALVAFRNAQQQFGLSERDLVIDVVTRWNSTFNMLEVFKQQRLAIHHVLTTIASTHSYPTDEEWQQISDLLELLRVPAQATNILMGEIYPCLSMALPLV
jgi:hypothetical protein